MKRRHWLAFGCAHCFALGRAAAQTPAPAAPYQLPPRFTRPDAGSDEGGLWALMDREELRVRRSPFRMREADLSAYLQGLAQKLAGEHAPDVRVYALRTPFFNASMAPNGMMQVWSGLLLRLENEAQLAAVMAHELGHYLQRHSVERLRDAKARSAFGTFMIMFGLVGAIASLATLASAFGFTRDQEREADQIGQDLMERAGYDPREAARVWANLNAELATNPAADPARNSPMLATHPNSVERSEVLATRAAQREGRRDEAAFLARIAPLRFELLADELRRGQLDETLVLLDRMLVLEPASAELLYYRGEVRRQRGQGDDPTRAAADLEAAVSAGREPPPTHRALGLLQRAAQRPAEARRHFERYLELAPEAPDAGLVRQYIAEGSTS
jgi:beta-barrel assembly-enhancing protease